MKAKASSIAQKLLNLYRQAHVINGGWAAVNRVLLTEATDEVLTELPGLPTGKMLVQHIKNLREGKTPRDSIARELLPYGGMMDVANLPANISEHDLDKIVSAIDDFDANQDGLDKFMNMSAVRKLGDEWISAIKNVLATHPDTLKKFDTIVRTWRAYTLWDTANGVIAKPITERTRAQVQVDMPEYETYLPMFGDEGKQLLRKLHRFTSSMPHQDSDD